VVVTAENFECRHRRQVVGQELAVDRHDVRALSGRSKRVDIGEVPPHDRGDCSGTGPER